MDDNLPVISLAEHEPGIPFVGDSGFCVDPQARLDEYGFNSVEFAKLARTPTRGSGPVETL